MHDLTFGPHGHQGVPFLLPGTGTVGHLYHSHTVTFLDSFLALPVARRPRQRARRCALLLLHSSLCTVCVSDPESASAWKTRCYSPANQRVDITVITPCSFVNPLSSPNKGALTQFTPSSHHAAVRAAVFVHQHDGVSGAIRYYPIIIRPMNPQNSHSTRSH